MKYLDKAFWKMAIGFIVLIGLGLFCIYLLSSYQANIDTPTLTSGG